VGDRGALFILRMKGKSNLGDVRRKYGGSGTNESSFRRLLEWGAV
jgi:hypothetical protein